MVFIEIRTGVSPFWTGWTGVLDRAKSLFYAAWTGWTGVLRAHTREYVFFNHVHHMRNTLIVSTHKIFRAREARTRVTPVHPVQALFYAGSSGQGSNAPLSTLS